MNETNDQIELQRKQKRICEHQWHLTIFRYHEADGTPRDGIEYVCELCAASRPCTGGEEDILSMIAWADRLVAQLKLVAQLCDPAGREQS